MKKKGYLTVGLWKNGKAKTRSIHRLVAIAFIPNPNNLDTVNHKDFNRHNNNVENLEWMSLSDNLSYTQYSQGIKQKQTYDEIRAREKRRYKKKREEYLAHSRQYYHENKEEISKRRREREALKRQARPPKVKRSREEYLQEYKEKNADRLREYQKNYYQAHKEKYHDNYLRKKQETNKE